MQENFRDGAGDSLIPVSDGDFLTDSIILTYEKGACWLRFYAADGVTPVTPTAGTINFSSATIEGQYQPSADGQIDATEVTITDAPYTPTRFYLPVNKSKMTLLGISANCFFVRAFHLRF